MPLLFLIPPLSCLHLDQEIKDNNSMVKYFDIYKAKDPNMISSRHIPVLQSIGKMENKF